MKTIKILHLYYNLMNLYGEQGNILALTSSLERQGLKVKVDNLSLTDKIELKNYDFIYIGSGCEENQELARQDILRLKKDFKDIIKDKFIIATGNAYELFGKIINNKEALGIFDFTSKAITNRIQDEQIFKTSLINYPVIGFQNRGSVNSIINDNLFEVISGSGNDSNNIEGIHKYNFYGTYLIGPLLVRNPYLTDKIVSEFCKQNKIDFKNNTNTLDYKAYNQFLENFNIEKQQ